MNHLFQFLLPIAIILKLYFPFPTDEKEIPINLYSEKDNYDVAFYHLDLNVSDTSTYLSGSVTINIRSVISPLQEVIFDFSNILITDSVKINGNRGQFIHESDEITITLADPAYEGELVSVQIYYHGLGRNHSVQGIYNQSVNAWNKIITYTLTEPFSALNFIPCKQSLTDKADSVYVFLSTDKDLKAGSNGLLTAQVPLPGDRIRYEWKSKYPIAYYLISFAVGDYMDYSFRVKLPGYNDSVLIQNYIYNDSNYLSQNKVNIDRTGDLMVLFSDLFGPYPFRTEKYGHCLAPFSGGMEHQTMTTLVNFSFLLVAHELAHQWFGDYVTCSTWQDIWINEGFASYGEYLAYQYLTSQTDADNWIRACNDYVKSATGGSVYVPEILTDNEGRIFDSRLSYKKGASIIHMIRQELGNDSLFFDIMASFLTKYANGNASGADFRDHVEEISKKDFSQFFNQWYYGEGYPIHTIRWNHRNDTLYINSLQNPSSSTPFFNLLLEFRVTGENLDTIVAFRQNTNYSQWQVYLPQNVNVVIPDPRYWLLIDVSDFSMTDDTGNENRFVVLPNPASDKVRITTSLNEPVNRYWIYMTNADGKIILKKESSSAVEEIDVHSYPAGIYFVIIKNGSSIFHRKLIVN